MQNAIQISIIFLTDKPRREIRNKIYSFVKNKRIVTFFVWKQLFAVFIIRPPLMAAEPQQLEIVAKISVSAYSYNRTAISSIFIEVISYPLYYFIFNFFRIKHRRHILSFS